MKKFLYSLPLVGGMLAMAGKVFAVANYVDLGDTFVADLLEYTTDLFSDLKVLVILVIGLPVGFWILRRVVGLVRVRG